MKDYIAISAPYFLGILLLNLPSWTATLAFRSFETPRRAILAATLCGVLAACALHFLFLWLSGFDPLGDYSTAGGHTVPDLVRLGGYPLLGWYPLAASLLGVALSLTAIWKNASR